MKKYLGPSTSGPAFFQYKSDYTAPSVKEWPVSMNMMKSSGCRCIPHVRDRRGGILTKILYFLNSLMGFTLTLTDYLLWWKNAGE